MKADGHKRSSFAPAIAVLHRKNEKVTLTSGASQSIRFCRSSFCKSLCKCHHHEMSCIDFASMVAHSLKNAVRARPDSPGCGRCGYPIIGLSEPRCPECGSPFVIVGISAREWPRPVYPFGRLILCLVPLSTIWLALFGLMPFALFFTGAIVVCGVEMASVEKLNCLHRQQLRAWQQQSCHAYFPARSVSSGRNETGARVVSSTADAKVTTSGGQATNKSW